MRTLKLTLSYDGTNYVGWQRQINGISVQQVVEEAFAPLMGGVAPTVAGAGRTDAGAHALGQVATVNTETEISPVAVQRALNVRLPFDVRVMAVEEATPGFHARFHATGKIYRYRVITSQVMSPFDRNYAWHSPEPKNIDLMREAAALLVGTHNFASFQARGSFVSDTVRTIHSLELRQAGSEITLHCDGDGFLRHMVRGIVGTLAEIGTGLRPPSIIQEMIDARDRRAAGATAPAHGLTLIEVRY